MKSPDELLTMLDDITNGIDDHGGVTVRDVVHDIIADIQDSFRLAISAEVNDGRMTVQALANVDKTMIDYIVNHYEDD